LDLSNKENIPVGGKDMMREIEGVTDEPKTRRRWFHDEYFDLFVWETETGDVTLFQLCYGTEPDERALVWHREAGLFHDGTLPERPAAAAGAPSPPATPATNEPIAARFEAAAKSLPNKVRRVVTQRVREYLTGEARIASRRKRFRREQWQDPPGAGPSKPH
jgi:hypothetical protein